MVREVCNIALLPLQLTCAKQESFTQKQNVVNPSWIQFAPFCVQDEPRSREQTLHCSGSCRRSQIPIQRFSWSNWMCICHLFASSTKALPAGPLTTSEGSIRFHQDKHSTSCSSERSTLSTSSSTVLVLATPAWARNWNVHFSFKILPP